MAIRIPRPAAVVAPEATAIVQPTLTREDVQAMLDANNAEWAKQIAELAKVFVASIEALPKPEPHPPRKVEPVRKKADDGEWLAAQRKRMKSQLDAVIAMVCAIAEEQYA